MKLHYDSQGSGPLIVLLHGFPEDRRSWKRQLPALAAGGFRAIAPDLRGYGESPKPRGVDAYRISMLVDDVAELIADAGGGPCIVVGHDWGALVAWFLAMTRPDLVRKLVVINVPHPAAYSRELRRSAEQRRRVAYQLFFQLPLLPELWMRLFGRRLLRKLGRFSDEETEAYARAWRGSLGPMLNYYRAMRKFRGELRALIRRIDVPVLMIWGEREPVFLRATTEGVDEWVPDLRFEPIPRIGHFAQHDAPDRVNELLIEFAGSGEGRLSS